MSAVTSGSCGGAVHEQRMLGCEQAACLIRDDHGRADTARDGVDLVTGVACPTADPEQRPLEAAKASSSGATLACVALPCSRFGGVHRRPQCSRSLGTPDVHRAHGRGDGEHAWPPPTLVVRVFVTGANIAA